MKNTWRSDIAVLLLVCLPLFVFVIASQTAQDIIFGDNSWYANRGTQFLQGERDSSYVYNLTYPLIVAVANRLVGDTALASVIANVLGCVLVTLLTYTLARMLFNRWVGVVSALLIATLPRFLEVSRLIQADIWFLAHILASAILCLWLIRKPSFVKALALGLMLGLAPFTRFEGAMYALLIPIASIGIWRTGHAPRRAVTLGVIAGVPFAVLLIAYLSVFATSVTGSNAGTGMAYALLRTIMLTPFRFDMLSMRFGEGLTRMIGTFPLVGWLVIGAAAYLWFGSPRRKHRWSVLLLLLLPAYNFTYTFTLSGYPFSTYLIHYVPFFCILLAWALQSLSARVASRMMLHPRIVQAAPLLIAMTLITAGVFTSVQRLQSAPFAFQGAPERASVQRLDTWLQTHYYPEHPTIYTFCPRLSIFSRSDVFYIYRLASNLHRDDNWNSPVPLSERMRADEGLLIFCENPIYYEDWHAVLSEPERLEALYEQVAIIQEYSIYRAR